MKKRIYVMLLLVIKGIKMKKSLIMCIVFLFSSTLYGETYRIKIQDYKNSIVVESSLVAYSLSCSEGVLSEEAKTCTLLLSEARVEGCPSGYIKSGETCYSDVTVPVTKYCSSGSSTGGGCSVTRYASKGSNCPSGYFDTGSICYSFSGSYVDFVNPTCNSGFDMYSNRCFLMSTGTGKVYGCPSGYTDSGSYCYNQTTYGYNYSCPSGLVRSGDYCTGTLTTSAVLSSCAEGYIEVGSDLCEKETVTPAIINCPVSKVYDVEVDACV